MTGRCLLSKRNRKGGRQHPENENFRWRIHVATVKTFPAILMEQI